MNSPRNSIQLPHWLVSSTAKAKCKSKQRQERIKSKGELRCDDINTTTGYFIVIGRSNWRSASFSVQISKRTWREEILIWPSRWSRETILIFVFTHKSVCHKSVLPLSGTHSWPQGRQHNAQMKLTDWLINGQLSNSIQTNGTCELNWSLFLHSFLHHLFSVHQVFQYNSVQSYTEYTWFQSAVRRISWTECNEKSIRPESCINAIWGDFTEVQQM